MLLLILDNLLAVSSVLFDGKWSDLPIYYVAFHSPVSSNWLNFRRTENDWWVMCWRCWQSTLLNFAIEWLNLRDKRIRMRWCRIDDCGYLWFGGIDSISDFSQAFVAIGLLLLLLPLIHCWSTMMMMMFSILLGRRRYAWWINNSQRLLHTYSDARYPKEGSRNASVLHLYTHKWIWITFSSFPAAKWMSLRWRPEVELKNITILCVEMFVQLNNAMSNTHCAFVWPKSRSTNSRKWEAY